MAKTATRWASRTSEVRSIATSVGVAQQATTPSGDRQVVVRRAAGAGANKQAVRDELRKVVRRSDGVVPVSAT
ncbi:MAG TPA: hypothetical protein VKV69_05195 [Actinomycetota bacterium]|nr:hypothetical protein [Actinomycetota bacterium]